jgi:hypothetical protein
MIVISSTSGRTLTVEQGQCGLTISVRDGRMDGRSILLTREAATEVVDAILEWLNKRSYTSIGFDQCVKP